MTSRAAGKGKAYFYYVCTRRKYYGRDAVGGCNAGRFNSDRLHAVFRARLSEMIRSDEVIDQVYQLTQRILGRQRGETTSRAITADLAKVERDLSLWCTRHDEAGGDAEKEAAWRRIVRLTEKEKALRQRLQEQESQSKPAKPLSREQVKEYLAGIETLVAKAGDRGRALVRSLVEHHGLSAQAKTAWLPTLAHVRSVGVRANFDPPGQSSHRMGRTWRITCGLLRVTTQSWRHNFAPPISVRTMTRPC